MQSNLKIFQVQKPMWCAKTKVSIYEDAWEIPIQSLEKTFQSISYQVEIKGGEGGHQRDTIGKITTV